MKKILPIVLVCVLILTPITHAHSGRTDANGGHNCSEKSKQKGLCSGYHYHNSGKSDNAPSTRSTSEKKSSSPASQPSKTMTKEKVEVQPKYTVSDIEVYVNHTLVPVIPLLSNDRTYIAVKELPSYWDIEVEWVQDEKLIRLSSADKKITLVLDSTKVFNDSKQGTLDSAPFMVNGSIYVPIKVLTAFFGWSLNYQATEGKLYTSND